MKSRYIKQDIDKKGRIKKSSRVVKLDEIAYWKQQMYFEFERADLLRSHLDIRNKIIVILIVVLSVLLIMWR